MFSLFSFEAISDLKIKVATGSSILKVDKQIFSMPLQVVNLQEAPYLVGYQFTTRDLSSWVMAQYLILRGYFVIAEN